MKEETIYVKGNATGYYLPKSGNSVGSYTINSFDWRTIDVRKCEVIENTDFEELKVGFYHSPIRKVDKVRVFVSEFEFIEESVSDFLFTEIKQLETFNESGDTLTKYESVVYFKLVKVIPPDPIAKKESKIARVIKTPFRTLQGTETPYYTSPNKTFFSTLLGGLIVSLIIGFLLTKLFGFGFFSIIIPIYFLLSVMFHGLQNRFSYFNNISSSTYSFKNIIGYLFVTYGLYRMYNGDFGNGSLIFLLLGLGFIMQSRVNRIMRIIGSLFVLVSVLWIISLLFDLFNETKNETIKEDETEYVERDDNDYIPEEEDLDVTSDNMDTISLTYLKHRHKWKDNSQRKYSGVFKVRKDHFNLARIKRNNLEVNENEAKAYYHAIYKQLIIDNKTYLNDIIKEYRKIGKRDKLNGKQFSDMIVTSIQNIPYYLVHDMTHREAERVYGGFIKEYHQSGGPCLAQIKFGIQSPVEFMANFKGDCDTRSVLLYYVLNHFGYKTVVLASDKYSHAIIGLSGNYNGDYVKYKGLKYYAWETTATGYVPGNLSPECNNMRYWYVALGSMN